MPTEQLHAAALAIALLGTSSLILACKKSNEPSIAFSGDSPQVVATGIRQRIEQTIQDTARREALLEAMDETDAMLAEMTETFVASLDTLARADADREKRKEDFRRVHAEIRKARSDALRRYVDIRLWMRELLTETEWNRISSGVPK